MFFRKELGDKYDEIEMPIWVEGGKESKNIARSLGLPAGSAREIADTVGIVSQILYGPEFQWSVLESQGDQVTSRITGCPLINRAVEMGLDPKTVLLSACHGYSKSIVRELHPGYRLSFKKRMCVGDRYCESVIESRK